MASWERTARAKCSGARRAEARQYREAGTPSSPWTTPRHCDPPRRGPPPRAAPGSTRPVAWRALPPDRPAVRRDGVLSPRCAAPDRAWAELQRSALASGLSRHKRHALLDSATPLPSFNAEAGGPTDGVPIVAPRRACRLPRLPKVKPSLRHLASKRSRSGAPGPLHVGPIDRSGSVAHAAAGTAGMRPHPWRARRRSWLPR